MSFDDDFAADALPDLLTEHGEAVTYKPNGGGSRSIDAIVNRNPPAASEAASQGLIAPGRMLLTVENDATSGISTDEIDTGGDKVTVALRVGGTATDRPITQLVNDDGGCTTFWVG